MTTETTERDSLAGYICPSCEVMFAILCNQSGDGVACPSCESLLRIPAAEEKDKEAFVKEDLQSVVYQGQGVTKNDQYVNSTRERQYSSNGQSETNSEAQPIDEQKQGGLERVLILLVITLFGLGCVVYFALKPNKTNKRIPVDGQTVSNVQSNIEEADLGGSSSGGEGELVTESDEGDSFKYDRSDDVQVARVEAFLKSWYEAKSIDEMLELVRPSDGLKNKMLRHYELHPVNLSELREVGRVKDLPGEDGYITYYCETQNYKKRFGVLQYSQDSILLDWESYVAYSEMSWVELIKKNPEFPVEVRARVKGTHYYSGEFSDEQKWRSVRLLNPNETDILYGYVLRGSADELRLFDFGNSNNLAFVLNVKYPPGSEGSNQLLIDKVVKKSWFKE